MGNEADERESLDGHYRVDRKHYPEPKALDNVGEIARRSHHAHQESKDVRRVMADSAKSVLCMDCGESYPAYVMDFDHVRGVKVKDISQMVQKHVPLEVLTKEIAKCEVVCANCHRIRTHSRHGLDNPVENSV